VTGLDAVTAAYPGWSIRRDAGQGWVSYVAQRVQVVVAPTPDDLAGQIGKMGGPPADDPRVLAARQLAAEHHRG
jgi:hypothetical protein